jgi:cation/acetate symporter
MFGNTAKNKEAASARFRQQLNRVYGWYTLAFLGFVVTLAVAEQLGMSRDWIGFMPVLAS